MSTYVDIHIIQNLPPSCVNRDDSGSPKSAVYGGVRRLRVSSQSWKRATRLYFNDLLDAEDIGVRTKRVVEVLRDAVVQRDPALAEALSDPARRVVLVTAHRRESWGEPMERIGRAVARLARFHPDALLVLPAHRNPRVREALLPRIAGCDNVVVTEPLEYGQFCTLMHRADVVLTDSGGIQEEAPALSKPVLVMRENTERPEAIAFGVARLVGTDEERIVAEVSRLLDDPDAYAAMARAVNPYGDGHAAARVLAALAAAFDRGERLPDFDPAPGR